MPTVVPTYDATSTKGYESSIAGSTSSWSHTCTGSNRVLVVGVSMLSAAGSSVSGITYNGVAMTLIRAKASAVGAVRVELWRLINPASGANTIAVTLSTGLDRVCSAVSFADADQTTPVEGDNDASATNSGAATDASVSITSTTDNCLVVDCVATTDTVITVGADQTQRQNATGSLGSGAMSTEGPKTPAGITTMSWTGIADLMTWTIVGVAVKGITTASPQRRGNRPDDLGSNILMLMYN